MKRSYNKKCKFESLTIKQAQHKNFALEEHLQLVRKVINQEQVRREDEIDKARKFLQKELQKVKHVKQPSASALNHFHQDRRKRIDDVCLHVVNCYLHKQDQNKNKWKEGLMQKEIDRRPVTTPEHLRFISEVFPEVMDHSVMADWKGTQDSTSNIYTHGRASHDMTCMSTRAKPVGVTTGAYPSMDPINVRLWCPPSKYARPSTGDQSSASFGRVKAKPSHRKPAAQGDYLSGQSIPLKRPPGAPNKTRVHRIDEIGAVEFQDNGEYKIHKFPPIAEGRRLK